MTREDLLSFLSGRLGVDVGAIDDDTSLFGGGVLDSFSLVDLILYLEEATGSKIPAGDVRLEHFDSVRRILEFTASRAP